MDCRTDERMGIRLSNPEGGSYVVDNRCGTDNSVAAGVGKQLHDGWVYPYFACDRYCCSVDTSHSRAKSHIVDGGVRHGRRSFTGNSLQPPLLLFAPAAE